MIHVGAPPQFHPCEIGENDENTGDEFTPFELAKNLDSAFLGATPNVDHRKSRVHPRRRP